METGLLTKSEAIKFLASAENANLIVTGVERLLKVEDGVLPDLDGIMNASSLAEEDPKLSIEAAKQFISTFPEYAEQLFTIGYHKKTES